MWLGVAVVVAVLMEPWAAFLHRRLWHGRLLWSVHASHHAPTGRLERNDAFSLLHVPPSIAAIIAGCQVSGWLGQVLFGVGIGMSVFGLGYVLVHDGLVHRRLPVGFLSYLPGIPAIVAAHKEHHRLGGAPFGLFLGPRELARRRQKRG